MRLPFVLLLILLCLVIMWAVTEAERPSTPTEIHLIP